MEVDDPILEGAKDVYESTRTRRHLLPRQRNLEAPPQEDSRTLPTDLALATIDRVPHIGLKNVGVAAGEVLEIIDVPPIPPQPANHHATRRTKTG